MAVSTVPTNSGRRPNGRSIVRLRREGGQAGPQMGKRVAIHLDSGSSRGDTPWTPAVSAR